VAIALSNPQGEFLLLKRKKTGRWAGLWELPRGPINERENPAEAASRVLWEVAGLKSSQMTQGIVIQHAITRFRVELACWLGRATGWTPQPLPEHDAFEWVQPSKFGDFAVASPQKKLLHWIEKQPTLS
jgi:adenine-specific DNA glycosylase